MSTSMLRKVSSLLLMVAPLMVAGCGDDDDPPGPGNGSFSATVTGDISATISGQALSGFATGENAFGMTFVTSDGRYGVVFVRTGARPGNGTYTVGDQAGDFAVIVTFDPTPQNATNDDDMLFAATSGQITITNSSGTGVTGTFSFDAEDFTGASTISVTGSFQSRCIAQSGFSCT